jgi:GNAT superfamily N-acetyltransferase
VPVTLFTAGAFRAAELGRGDIDLLQRFYDLNPEYHRIVSGEAPGATEAQDDFDSTVPEGWPYTRRWILGLFDEGGAMIGVADLISDLFAPGVWNVGLFVVATRLHGQGAAQALYSGLESWMRDNGARWLRLGVVEGNARGARFWERSGYVDVRKRHGYQIGRQVNTLRVMAKALAGGSLAQYLEMVARDRTDAP